MISVWVILYLAGLFSKHWFYCNPQDLLAGLVLITKYWFSYQYILDTSPIQFSLLKERSLQQPHLENSFQVCLTSPRYQPVTWAKEWNQTLSASLRSEHVISHTIILGYAFPLWSWFPGSILATIGAKSFHYEPPWSVKEHLVFLTRSGCVGLVNSVLNSYMGFTADERGGFGTVVFPTNILFCSQLSEWAKPYLQPKHGPWTNRSGIT